MSEAAVVELNIPTGEPLVYQLDERMQPLESDPVLGTRGRYLDPTSAATKADAVAKQAG